MCRLKAIVREKKSITYLFTFSRGDLDEENRKISVNEHGSAVPTLRIGVRWLVRTYP